ncbi:MAG: tape measure protein [Candidatus Thiodiazotropha endolucinida]
MADRKQISLYIKTIVEGLKEIDKLVSEIDELGGQAGETGQEAKALNAEFQRLQKQQNAISQFQKLNSSIAKTAKDLDTARAKATSLGRAMASAERPTKALANQFETARQRVRRLKDMQAAQTATLSKYSNKMKAAGVDTKRLIAEQVRLTNAMSGIRGKITGVSAELSKTRNHYRQAAKEARGYGDSVSKAGKLSAAFGRLLPVAALAGAVKWFKDAAVGAHTLQKGFEVVSGSTETAAKEMDYLRQTASRLGLPLREAGKAYLSLAAAAKGTALEGQASRDIFEAVSTAMGRLGRTSAETEGALLAIQQMISKGKVSAEELRGQLGERLPGAFQAAARAMGVTTAELGDMLQAGEIIAEDLLPKLAGELNKLYDDGTRIETFGASWNRLKNSVSGAFAAINESSGAMNLLGETMEYIGSAVTVLSVGFVTLVEKIKGATIAVKAFYDAATSKDTTLTDALRRTADAWRESEEAIRKAADTAFNADSKLSQLGTTTRNTSVRVEELGSAAADAASKTTDLANASEGTNQTTVDLAQNVNELATQYREGAISAAEYLERLRDLRGLQQQQQQQQQGIVKGNQQIADSSEETADTVTQAEEQMAVERKKGLNSFANHWKRVYDTYHAISAAAGKAYDSLFEKFKRMGVAAKDYRLILKMTHDFLEKLDVKIKNAAISAQGYSGNLKEVIKEGVTAIRNMKVLDAQKLNQLKAQIGQARAAMRALNDESRDTLSTLRQELASLRGDTLAAERLRYQQRLEDLQADLANAQRSGVSDAAANYRNSLSALREIHELRMRQIKEEQQAQGSTAGRGNLSSITRPSRSGSGISNNLVQIRLQGPDGQSTSVYADGDGGVANFINLLRSSGARTG